MKVNCCSLEIAFVLIEILFWEDEGSSEPAAINTRRSSRTERSGPAGPPIPGRASPWRRATSVRAVCLWREVRPLIRRKQKTRPDRPKRPRAQPSSGER
ncbi:hypothetical protein ROHU_002654 [Labeo rohita]|uniref:Uncharacterized protein n=1 Tax=Labeo rohita TaxID=84645 RepID=A0A498NZN2_LABRO|nr:hypothetical protein ROHU_002654 [Labeo rohita]